MENLIVIKIGGNAMNELTEAFYTQVMNWRMMGKKVLIVHGGGNKITEFSRKLHLPVRKDNGIRVTDFATLELTRMVLLGFAQPQILQHLADHDLSAIGLHAAINHLITGTCVNRERYGFVGEITQVNEEVFASILETDIGVLAPLAIDEEGSWLNINGDTAAASIASLLQAEALYLITDVPGVLNEGKVLPQLDANQASLLQQQNIITAGMQPKLRAAFHALQNGVEKIMITNTLSQAGTAILKEGAHQYDYTISNL
ncbi:acetylglutamate kinase [Enterococcus camelliae]|uniref:Acetylglutamate kinase n=1 Tax=Enterococcus camelliae TaxID=453959 RepID=A0ABW5THM0_9ENTE